MRKSCVIYDSWADQLINLPKEMAGEYIQAILTYAIYGEDMEVEDPAIKAMLIPVKKKLDDDLDKYQAKVERAKTISKRNRNEIVMISKRNRNDIEGVTVTDTVTVTDKDIKEKDKKKSFLKPTVDDVKAYCQERGNKVDPYQFVDFYESKGWKVGNQPMKDWKAAVRTWEKRDSGKSSPSKTPYKGRTYDFKALEGEFLGNVRQE